MWEVLEESNADLLLSDMDFDNPTTILFWVRPEGQVIKATATNDVPYVEILGESEGTKEAANLTQNGFTPMVVTETWNKLVQRQGGDPWF